VESQKTSYSGGMVCCESGSNKDAKKGVKMKTTEQKYREVLAKLHICRPAEKAGLKQLLNYYYRLLH